MTRHGPTVRFLHSADWQLGMTRHFLEGEAQARFAQARIDVIGRMGKAAQEHGAEFLVVAGDVFETNQVSSQTVRRTLAALETVPVPVFLLPGNHDPLDAGSVYRSSMFLAARPAHVTVLEDGAIHEVRPGVEVTGAPWFSKRPLTDLVAEAAVALEPAPGVRRVLVAHGSLAEMMDFGNPAAISQAGAERAIAEHRLDYLALGDRHSTTPWGATGRIWHAGAPEPTDYDEANQRTTLLVELGPETCEVTRLELGRWTFALGDFDLDGPERLGALERWLGERPAKDRAIVKLKLRGTISITERAQLDELLQRNRDLYAAIEEWERHTDIVVRPDDDDFEGLGLGGFAEVALGRLRAMAAGAGEDAEAARDALGLLVRLAGKGVAR